MSQHGADSACTTVVFGYCRAGILPEPHWVYVQLADKALLFIQRINKYTIQYKLHIKTLQGVICIIIIMEINNNINQEIINIYMWDFMK